MGTEKYFPSTRDIEKAAETLSEILEPTRVVVVGILPDELDNPVDIINFENRATKKNKELGEK